MADMDTPIKVKTQNIFLTLMGKQADRKLIYLVCWMAMVKEWPLVVTDFYRKGSRGVHGTDPVRGLDIRSWIYPDPRAIEFEINDNWIYDNTRPDKQVALYHNAGSGYHFHLQVHPLTEFVGPQKEFIEIQRFIAGLI